MSHRNILGRALLPLYLTITKMRGAWEERPGGEKNGSSVWVHGLTVPTFHLVIQKPSIKSRRGVRHTSIQNSRSWIMLHGLWCLEWVFLSQGTESSENSFMSSSLQRLRRSCVCSHSFTHPFIHQISQRID